MLVGLKFELKSLLFSNHLGFCHILYRFTCQESFVSLHNHIIDSILFVTFRLGLLSESQIANVEMCPNIQNNQLCTAVIQEIRNCIHQKDLQSAAISKVTY